MATGVYGTYSVAPKSDVGGTPNMWNTSTVNDIKAMTVGVDVSVIPHALHLGAAYRNATTNANKGDNALTLQAIYDLSQNVALHAVYSSYSGTKYDAVGVSKSLFTGMLEAAW
jgi:hypothetical protein